MRQKGEDTNADSDLLPFMESVRRNLTSEHHFWMMEARQLSMPIKAGISGTTERLLNAAGMLNIGVAMTHVRLAAFGYLIPDAHHSFHEIMSGAAGFPGCAYTPGDYSKIAPLDASLIQSWDPPAPLDAKVKT